MCVSTRELYALKACVYSLSKKPGSLHDGYAAVALKLHTVFEDRRPWRQLCNIYLESIILIYGSHDYTEQFDFVTH